MALIVHPEKTMGKIFLFLNNMILLQAGNSAELPDADVFEWYKKRQILDYWLYDSGYDYTAAFLKPASPIAAHCSAVPLRTVFALHYPFAGDAARGRALLNWRRAALFCSRCGAAMIDAQDELACVCPACESRIYPAPAPAMIVQVHKGEQLLLAKHNNRSMEVYTCLAGYVEPGETLEACVVREVWEEVKLKVTNVRYAGSHGWPFPNQLMLGFHADWCGGDIHIQEQELQDARWFSKDLLPAIPPEGSIAYSLITGQI